MFTVLSVLGINLLAYLAQKINAIKGSMAVHVFIAIIAIGITTIWQYAQVNPSFMAMLKEAGMFLVAAVGTYEVLWKKIFPPQN